VSRPPDDDYDVKSGDAETPSVTAGPAWDTAFRNGRAGMGSGEVMMPSNKTYNIN